MSSGGRYWFPAKRFGWGWGCPCAWQGWAVLAVFVGLVVAGATIFPPHRALASYLAVVAGLSVVLVAIAWWTGEPPRWRRGDD